MYASNGELLRQMCQASKAIGKTELENKFAEGKFTIIDFNSNAFKLLKIKQEFS